MSHRRWGVWIALPVLVLGLGWPNLASGQNENIITITNPVVFSGGSNTVNGITPVPPFPPLPPGTGVAVSSFNERTVQQQGGRAYDLDVTLPFFQFLNSITSTNAAANITSSSQMTWNGTLLIPTAPGQAVGTPVNATIRANLALGREQANGASSGEVAGRFNVTDGINNPMVSVTPFGAGPSVNSGGTYNNVIASQNTPLRVGVPVNVALQFDLKSILNGVGETINDIRQFKLHIETQNAPPANTANVAFIDTGLAWGGHSDLRGLVVAESVSPVGLVPAYEDHATGVASRFYPDRANLGIDGGKASADRWRTWTYQTEAGNDASKVAAIEAVAPAVKIINMSLGLGNDTSGNDSVSKAFDKAAFTYRNLVTKSAGNNGSGAVTLTRPGGAYNMLTVGATTNTTESPVGASLPLFSFTPAAVNVAGFSSRGPTTDGRYKPDIVAPGTNLTMAAYGDGSDPNALQNGQSGTSFAAPYVASVAAHLIEEGIDTGRNTDPMVIKAVLLNSAQEVRGDPWNGWTPATTNIPLDPDQGAGEVSTARADQQYLTNPEQNYDRYVKLIGWDYGESIVVGQFRNYAFELPLLAGSVLNATLDWFRELDNMGNPFPLVDDLDLELWTFDGLLPRALVTLSNSLRDNVEHIHRFFIPTQDTYGLRAHFLIDFTGNGADQYGLAWYATPVPEPSTVVLTTIGGLLVLFVWRRGRGTMRDRIAAAV